MSNSKFRIILISLLICTLLAGCNGGGAGGSVEKSPPPQGADGGIKVAMIFNHLGDVGVNDEAFAGLKQAGTDLGVAYDYVEASNVSEVETQIRMFADTEEYDLILVFGADRKDTIEAVAADYPDQKFSLIDSGVSEMPNLHGVGALDQEQTFLSGVIAGLVTIDDRMPLSNPDNVIGFVGGMDSPASRAGAAGFMSGAKYVNPDVEIIYTIVGDYRDPAKGKEIALTAYGRGADIVSHNAGGSGMGVFSAAEEMDRYVIGSSLASVDPDHSLCTSVKRTDLFVYQEIESIVDGTWSSGTTLKGIKEGVCGYNIDSLNTNLPEDIIQKVEDIKQKVINGSLVVPSDPNDIDQWLKSNQYEA